LLTKPIFIFLVSAFLALSACDSPEEQAQSHLESANSLFAQNKPKLARLEFKNVLKINAKAVPAWYGLAQVEERQGNWEKAFGLLKKVISLDPSHVQAQVKLGRYLLLSGQLDEALGFSTAALKLEPANPAARTLHAAVLFKLNDKEGAVQAAKSALEVDPLAVDAVAILVAERLAANDIASALTLLDRHIELDKGNIALRLIKIRTLDASQKSTAVKEEFHNLIALYPNRRDFRKALIDYLLAHKQPDEAVAEAQQFAAAYPDDPAVRLYVVSVLNRTKGSETAESELSALIRGQPENMRFRFALARLNLAQGKVAEAAKILRQISESTDDTKTVLAAKAELARIFLRKKELDKAGSLVEEILEKDKNHLPARLLRASVSIENGRLEQAIADLRAVLNYAPQSTSALLLLAKAHQLNGNGDLAEDRFAEAYRVSGADANIGLRYAHFLMGRSKTFKAEAALTTILAREPENVSILRALAQVQLAQNDWHGAQDVTERLKKIDGNKTGINKILGQVLEGQGRFDESIAYFQSAYKASPSALSPMTSLVRAYMRGGRMKDARRFLNSVLESNGKNVQALVLLAELNLAEKRGLEETEALLNRALSYDPRSAFPYRALARFYASQGKYTEAESVVARGQADNPNDAGLRLILAENLEKQGRPEEAIREYEKLLSGNPDSDLYANNLAALLSTYRNDRESLQRAYRLAKRFRDTTQPNFKDTLGWIYHRLGSIQEARATLRDAVNAAPQSAIIRYHLGMALLANGETAAATEQLKRSLELANNQSFGHREEIEKILKNIQ